jgi:PTH1 family peptidyl-tRNA hydrolase
MQLIVGLGNPEKKYEQTRHNVGFLVVDALARKLDARFSQAKNQRAEIAEVSGVGEKIILLKPQTFMNLSGEAVAAAMSFWKIPHENVTIVYDDADIPFGEIRSREEGSSGGHKGMQSIINSLGRHDIARVRIGIGRPDNPTIPLEDWVLAPWTAEEEKSLRDIIERAASQLYGRDDHT